MRKLSLKILGLETPITIDNDFTVDEDIVNTMIKFNIDDDTPRGHLIYDDGEIEVLLNPEFLNSYDNICTAVSEMTEYVLNDYIAKNNIINCFDVFFDCKTKDTSIFLSVVLDYVRKNRRKIGSLHIHLNKEDVDIEERIIERIETFNKDWDLDRLNLNPDNFTEETNPKYGLDWLVFESYDQTITIQGYYYNHIGYRIKVSIPGDRLIITHDFTQDNSIKEYNPEAKPWMNLWWKLYNSSQHVRTMGR